MSIHEYGPFSPQELEKVVNWLKSQNLEFEILKDDQAEKKFQQNDIQNTVALGRFRTDIYLAQIYTVQVQSMTSDQILIFQQLFAQVEEVPLRLKQEISEVVDEGRLLKNNSKKRFWAWILILFPVVYFILVNIFKGE